MRSVVRVFIRPDREASIPKSIGENFVAQGRTVPAPRRLGVRIARTRVPVLAAATGSS